MTPSTPSAASVSAPARTIIATRESRLALWQAEHVRDLLVARFGLAVDLLGMTTRGDEILNVTLSKVGGKGLFVKELETALDEGRAHLAVHSLKDVPMDLPPGFALAAVLQREDPRDAWVSNRFASLAELPQGAKVGTSSLRRVVQLRAMRPDLVIEPVRGNLDTRLRKLDEGQYDAIVLAAAGLKRLGLSSRIRCVFEPEQMLPCAGQGALGLEVRGDAHALLEQLASLSHTATELAVHAERAVSRALGGSCSMPLAAYATFGAPSTSDSSDARHPFGSGGVLALRVALGHPEQTDRPLLHAAVSAPVATEAEARALGEKAAGLLREAGAVAYLAIPSV